MNQQHQTLSVRDFGASGSDASTTGTVTGNTVALTSAIDFADGQGVIVDHAGPACTLATPGAPSLSKVNAGSTTYRYRVAALTASGGVSVPSDEASIAACVDTLGLSTGWVDLSWSAVTDAVGYAIYGDSHGQMELRTIVLNGGTTWTDHGQPNIGPYPTNVPRSLPSTSTNEFFVTRIVDGGGTTTITLDDTPDNAGLGLRVGHDDTAACQAAILNARQGWWRTDVYFPSGTYLVTRNLMFRGWKCNDMVVFGDGGSLTAIQDNAVEQADTSRGEYGLIGFSQCSDATLRDMSLMGTCGAHTAYYKKGVYVTSGGYGGTHTSVTVARVTCSDFSGEAIYADSDCDLTVRGCVATNCQSNAINLNTSKASYPNSRLMVDGCDVVDCMGCAILAGGGVVTVRTTTVRNAVHSAADAVNFAGVGHLDVDSLLIEGCVTYGFGVNPMRLGFGSGSDNFDVAGTVRNVTIRNNHISCEGGGLGGAIHVQNARGPLIIENCTLASNGRASGTGHAIEVDGAETGTIVIRNNTFVGGDYATKGVNITATAAAATNADIIGSAAGNSYGSDIDSGDQWVVES